MLVAHPGPADTDKTIQAHQCKVELHDQAVSAAMHNAGWKEERAVHAPVALGTLPPAVHP